MKMSKSASVRLKVQEKLVKVQEEVRSSFNLLYTSDRSQLLPKAMELERCESVKDQLRALETRAATLLKAYNSLQNKRREKDLLLAHLLHEQESIRPPYLTEEQASTATAEIDRKYAETLSLIDRETDYTSVLDHMIAENAKAITRKVQPIYHLRKELQQVKIRFHENEVDCLRISLDQKSIKNSIRRSEELLDTQKSHHGHKVEEKMLEFRRRKEFEEFVERQKGQKQLEELITDNEVATRRMEEARRAVQSAEEFVAASKSRLEMLSEYERETEKLSKAAHTSSIQQVLEYWDYLQSFGSNLQLQVDTGTQRVSSLRDELAALRTERTSVRLELEPAEALTRSQLTKLRALLELKEEKLEAMAAGVSAIAAEWVG